MKTTKEIMLILLLMIAIPSAKCQNQNLNLYNNILIIEHPDWKFNDLIVGKMSEYFESIGFNVINETEFERMQQECAIKTTQTLFLTYNYQLCSGCSSSVAIELISITDNVRFYFSGAGYALTPGGDLKSAMKKIFEKIDKLNYHFDPAPFTKKALPELAACSWSEDSIRLYMNKNKISPIEGIYKNYDTDSGLLSLYIVKDNKKYYGIVLSSKNWIFEKGDALYEFEYISDGVYDMVWLDSEDESKNIGGMASYTQRILTMNSVGDKLGEIKLVKTYPPDDEKQASNTISDKGLLLSATGSGIMIADGIVATNNHVIDGAKKIEVLLNINGEQRSYTARVLCVDKTNDLVLLSIKDDKYTSVDMPPFKILPNVVDVGASVFTMGYPMTDILGEELKVTDGIISSKSGYDGDIVTYQISAPIQPGNSGGALFDKKGNLVGITNAGVPGAENVGYAIKSSYLLNLIDSAPINIRVQTGRDTAEQELSNLVKTLTPYVAYIKVY